MEYYPRCLQIFLIVLSIVYLTYAKELATDKNFASSLKTPSATEARVNIWTTRSSASMISSTPIAFGTTPAASPYVSVNPIQWRRFKDKNNKPKKRKKRPTQKSRLRTPRRDQRKYPYEKPLRGFRRPKVTENHSVVKMMQMPAMRWLHRWFFDVYQNKYQFTDIVFTPSKHPGKAYVTVCPAQKRLRFEVEAQVEFTIYLMQTPFANGGQDFKYDNNLGSTTTTTTKPNAAATEKKWAPNKEPDTRDTIPKNTIRISVRDRETRLVILNKNSSKILQSDDITKEKELEYAIFQHESISSKQLQSYWLWWEQNGFIYMGRDYDPPYLAYLVGLNPSDEGETGETRRDENPIINIRAIAFSVSHSGAVGDEGWPIPIDGDHYKLREKMETVSFLIHLEFPHGDKECNCSDKNTREEDIAMGGIATDLI